VSRIETSGEPSGSGLDPHVAAALAYGLGWVTGLLFLLIEPDNKFVRFHAIQSIIVFAALSVFCLLLQMVPLLGMLVTVFLVVPASAVLWLVLMFKAYQGKRFKLPIAGDMAEQRI
jgi:uncharacterized membrane protein